MTDTTVLPIAPRYTRAVHIQRDFYKVHRILDGYQVTPLVVQTAARVLASLNPNVRGDQVHNRAFSLVGPFGAGKSAFGLFLAHYMQCQERERRQLLHSLAAHQAALPIDVPALLPVLVPGNNSSLRRELLSELHQMLLRHLTNDDSDQRLLAEIQSAIATSDPQHATNLVERASRAIARRQRYYGIIIIIDELGQYLDFAARQGEERDLFLLQSLAEMASRSGDVPCLLVTILHQAFERYTLSAGHTRRIEWAKVQGRFVDLPFQEPTSQMIRMVAHALHPAIDDPYHHARTAWSNQLAPAAETLGLRPTDIRSNEWVRLVAGAYPLHPTVLIALPHLFRQLAQNERSLFAFLHTDEPWGLRDVVRAGERTINHLPIYRLTHLCAYVEATLGPSLFTRARGQRWAELAEARTLLGDSDPVLLDTLTVIGTIGALERSSGLRANRAQIALALADHPTDPVVEDALLALQSRRLVTYRQHRDCYIIWEGSDLDLDALTQEARRAIADRATMSALLQSHADTTPRIARRHSYHTGATRTFTVRYVEVPELSDVTDLPQSTDGELLCVVPADEEELARAVTWASAPIHETTPQRVVVLPRRVRELRELLLDVAVLRHLLNERPELENDRVARREVASRLIEAQQVLSYIVAETYGGDRSRWFWRGKEIFIKTSRDVDELLSRACDQTYPDTPLIWNELIVRSQLSSAAAKARRNLIEAMLERSHEPLLGLVGYPPERAIYESVLKAGGLHRLDTSGNWHIAPPPEEDPLRLRPSWNAIEQFLETAAIEPRPLTDLFAVLEQPPYGVKAGMIPVLFVSFYVARAGEIVLYERGNYVSIPDIALFERLLSRPESFAARLSRAEGARLAVYERLAKGLAPRALTQPVQPALLTTALPLLRLMRGLPEFSKQTRRISQRAQAIRAALQEARAPDELLFEHLPLACGFAAFHSYESADSQRVEDFIGILRDGLQELQNAYPQLIETLTTSISRAFQSASTSKPTLRAEIIDRYNLIADTTNDVHIRALGVRLETTDEQSDAWIESVAALIAKRPPDLWNDRDIVSFEIGIADLGRRFRAVEEVAVAAQAVPEEAPVLRIGLSNGRSEVSRVLRIVSSDQAVQQLQADLQAVLERHTALSADQQATALAAILESLLKLEKGISSEEQGNNL